MRARAGARAHTLTPHRTCLCRRRRARARPLVAAAAAAAAAAAEAALGPVQRVGNGWNGDCFGESLGSWREHGTGVSVDVHVRPTRCRYLDELVSSSIASSQRYLLDQTSRKISHTRGMRFHGSHAEYDAIRRHRSLSFATRGGSIDAPTRREAFTGFSTLSRAPAQPPDPLGKQHKRLSKHPDARRDATNSRLSVRRVRIAT